MEQQFQSSNLSNSVQLNLSSSPVSHAAVKVSLIEVVSKLYDNGSAPFMSNSLEVNIAGINHLYSDESGSSSIVVINLKSNNFHYFDVIPVNFTTICHMGKSINASTFTCPQSEVVLTHNCTGKNGKLVSHCPILQPACVITDATVNIGKCIMIAYTPLTTTCSCTIYQHNQNSSIISHFGRKLLSEDMQNALDSTGVMNLVSMSEYVGSEFVDTFDSVKDFGSIGI